MKVIKVGFATWDVDDAVLLALLKYVQVCPRSPFAVGLLSTNDSRRSNPIKGEEI